MKKINPSQYRPFSFLALILTLSTTFYHLNATPPNSPSHTTPSSTTTHTSQPTNSYEFNTADFKKHIQPLFETHCYKCHGPKKRKAGLRLDNRKDALLGGDSGKVIIPHKPNDSELYLVITTDDEEFRMPPKGDPLTKKQTDLIKQWIQSGAPWPEDATTSKQTQTTHWSFITPKPPTIPKVNNQNWPRNPIDNFVLHKLERNNLSPSPTADKYTLIRRLYLDLIGLPPTPEQAAEFVNDNSPNAYEKQVDKLLASPHYGERWARRWLDLARYADTNGYEKDRVRSIWPYRDYVINAINQDMPYDQFIIEQVAGDMLPNATPQQKTATGFHRNTMINEEGGIDVEEYRYLATVDRINTIGTSVLGLTVACAQCHTHKYDPITQREYYQLFAFVNNADEPELKLPNPNITNRRHDIQQQIKTLIADLPNQYPTQNTTVNTTPIKPQQATALHETKLTINDDHSITASGPNPPTNSYTLTLNTDLKQILGLRIEALPLPNHTGPGRTKHGNFVLTNLTVKAAPLNKPNQQTTLKLTTPRANINQNGYHVSQVIDNNPRTGWGIDDGSGNLNKPAHADFNFNTPLNHPAGTQLTVTLDHNLGSQHTLAHFRISLITQSHHTKAHQPSPLQEDFKQWIHSNTLKSTPWTPLIPSKMISKGNATFTPLTDQSILVSGDHPNFDTYDITFTPPTETITAIRLEVLPHESLPGNGPGRAPLFSVGDFLLSEVKLNHNNTPLKISNPTHSFAQPGRAASTIIDGKLDTGWAIKGRTGEAHHIVIPLDKPLNTNNQPLTLTLIQQYIHQLTIGRFRISTTNAPLPVTSSKLPAQIEHILTLPQSDWTKPQHQTVFNHFLLTTPKLAAQQAQIAKLRKSMPNYTTTMVMTERPDHHPRQTHIHHRGDFLKPTEPVAPGTPEILPPLPKDAPRNRLTFAKWLVDEQNPLTARVIMNRHWEAFFGRGIVKTLEDFGTQYSPPTHPDLLDYLATQLMQRDWSQKQMHKLIVMSATYRQSSKVTPQLLEKDPENLLLARASRFRVEAEIVRDIALTASNLLTRKVGGPSVFPPQPPGVTSLSYGAMAWKTSTGPDRYRRSIYTFAKRTTPYAMLTLFDAGSGESCLPKRERSNTPLQALTLLNDITFLEAAQHLARETLEQPLKDDLQRMTHMFQSCLTRPPSEPELTRLITFLNNQRQRLRKGELNPNELLNRKDNNTSPIIIEQAAWFTVARALLNLEETTTRE